MGAATKKAFQNLSKGAAQTAKTAGKISSKTVRIANKNLIQRPAQSLHNNIGGGGGSESPKSKKDTTNRSVQVITSQTT